MARIAEPQKIENIKKAVMELLIEHGYGSMSIATVSEKAGVSPGYLYRYYKSKEELVRELVDLEIKNFIDAFEKDIDTSLTAAEAGYKFIYKLFMQANEDPILAKFVAAVVMDVKVPSREKSDKFKMVRELAEKIIRLGVKTGEINPKVTPMEVVIVAFTLPFRYISISLEMDNNKKFTREDAERITEICLNSFK